MLVYIDLEHEKLSEIDHKLWQCSRTDLLRNKYRFEQLAQRPCLIIRYDSIFPARLAALNPAAVLVSGHYLEISDYAPEKLAGLITLYREWQRPLLGFCGGHQLLAQAYGAPIGPLSQIPDGVTQLHLATIQNVTGIKQEIGFQPVHVSQTHPLFHNLNAQAQFYQAHYWEVKDIPNDFEVLASSDHCPIQAIAHKERPLFGTQFHPEEYNDRYSDGRQLLKNFFQLADVNGVRRV